MLKGLSGMGDMMGLMKKAQKVFPVTLAVSNPRKVSASNAAGKCIFTIWEINMV